MISHLLLSLLNNQLIIVLNLAVTLLVTALYLPELKEAFQTKTWHLAKPVGFSLALGVLYPLLIFAQLTASLASYAVEEHRLNKSIQE